MKIDVEDLEDLGLENLQLRGFIRAVRCIVGRHGPCDDADGDVDVDDYDGTCAEDMCSYCELIRLVQTIEAI